MTRPFILLAGKRGHNHRHLRNIVERGELARDARVELHRLSMPGRVVRRELPERLDDMLAVHLSRRRADRPWLFRFAPLRTLYLAGVRRLAVRLYSEWVNRLREARPDAVVLWNGHRLPESAVRHAAMALGIRIIYVENGCLPNTRTLDAAGVNAENSVPRDPAFFRNRKPDVNADWKLVPRKLHRSKSADDIVDSPDVAEGRLPERYVFIPFQVDTDSQLVVHSPHVPDMRALYELVEQAMRQVDDPELVVLFKEHPTSPYVYPDLHERSERNPRLRFANSRNTQELIENAETVVTINSTVGIEALLFLKRVVTLGDAFYNIDGLVKHATNANELAAALADRDWSPDENIARGLVDYLRNDYCVPMSPARNGEDDWRAMATRILDLARA